jgi:SAM-dependent methyltransferase
MPIELSPRHRDLVFMSPLSESRADRLAHFIAAGSPALVLDLGCGWAELLLRALTASPASRGIGIDHDAGSIEHGLSVAASRGVADRVDLTVGDAGSEAPAAADAVICLGATQIWADPVPDSAGFTEPINYRSALTAIRDLVPRGGRAVYGEGIWSAAPTEAAIAPLAGRLDEFVALPELVEVAAECGFMPMAVHEASTDEWDAFESGYTACYARWLAEHAADDPDAAAVRDMAQRQRTAYFGGYRGILGMAYLELLAT